MLEADWMLFFMSGGLKSLLFLEVIIVMQGSQNLSQMLLPREARGADRTTSKEGRRANFYSNCYEIKLKDKAAPVYQFCMDITPELPANSNALREKIVGTLHGELKKLIGVVCHRGDMIWGRRPLTKPENLIAEFERAKEHFRFEVLLKPVKELSLENFLLENPDDLAAICQVLNINTKNMLRKAKMTELTLGTYYDETTINDNASKESGLSVWRGFNATIAPFNGKIFLQVDVCSRILREESFLTTLERERKEMGLQELNLKYKGSPILMRYGNLKVYKIDGLEFKMSPKSTFYFGKEGREISYIEYFQTKYGYAVKNEKQPMVRVEGKRPRLATAADPPVYIYLVPEMLTLTGLTDAQRSNFRIMKSLDPFTKLSPQQRMGETAKLLGVLQGQEELMFKIKSEPHQIEGYQLEAPEICLGPNKRINIRNGSINLRERVLEPHEFKTYYFCYSVGKDASYDQEDCDFAIDQIKKAAGTFGIKVCEPYWLEVDYGRDFRDWQQALEKKVKAGKGERIEIMVFFLKPQEERLYSELKRFVSTNFNCPSQCIRRKSLSTATKGVLSFASKIILQMNSKIGHPLWSVPNYHPYWKEKFVRVAVAGIAASKGKQGSVLGFVGSTNPELTHIITDAKEVKNREGLSSALFQGMFTAWIQNYFVKNQKSLPSVLVIYREGLNDVQARHQFEIEVQGLLETINVVRTKTKTPDYNPTIEYLLVNKKPNSRIYERGGSGKNVTYDNPLPGSVIFEDLSKEGYREFHLASVEVRIGSCTPVEFKVGFENKKNVSGKEGRVPLDALAELTYNQCYCYYNWTGGVRVPASLQYANKLAKQCTEIGMGYINEEKGSDLKFKPFFL